MDISCYGLYIITKAYIGPMLLWQHLWVIYGHIRNQEPGNLGFYRRYVSI